MNRPKKCPRCNSSKVLVIGFKFYCKKCGFLNDLNQLYISTQFVTPKK